MKKTLNTLILIGLTGCLPEQIKIDEITINGQTYPLKFDSIPFKEDIKPEDCIFYEEHIKYKNGMLTKTRCYYKK